MSAARLIGRQSNHCNRDAGFSANWRNPLLLLLLHSVVTGATLIHTPTTGLLRITIDSAPLGVGAAQPRLGW